jgi:hypothetical protein
MPRHEIIELIQRSAVFLAAILGLCARDYFALVMRVLVLFLVALAFQLSVAGAADQFARRLFSFDSLGSLLALLMWASIGWGIGYAWRKYRARNP